VNWDAVGAIGEIMAAVGVIVTLVYLTAQIRQNTKSINSNNSNSVMAGFNQLNVAMLDPEVSRICYEGFFRIDEMSESERNRFTHLMNGFFNIFRNLYHQFLDGTFPADQWESWALEARQMMETPGVEYFRTRTRTYEDLFSYLEQMPEDSPKPLALGVGIRKGA